MSRELSKAKSTRRTVSMRGVLFRRARWWCERNDESIAGLVTRLLADFLEERGVPQGDPGPQPRGHGGRPKTVKDERATLGLGGIMHL